MGVGLPRRSGRARCSRCSIPSSTRPSADHYLDLAVRPLEGAVHLHREHARHDPRAAPRPDGRDPALRLHRTRRSSGSRSATSCRSSSKAHGLKRTQLAIPDQCAPARDRRVHARGRRSQSRAADRDALPQGGDALSRPGHTEKLKVDEERRARVARAAALLRRRAQADGRSGRRNRARRTRLSAATCSSSRRPPTPARASCTITGQLGEVMQESAQAALSWVRSHTEELGSDPEWFAEHDVHIHVPAGAVPKDGPSAGVTMATATRVARARDPGRRGRRHDGRDHADRTGACRSAACARRCSPRSGRA